MKNTMKTLIFGFLAIVLTHGITSCGGDETEDPKSSEIEQIKVELSGLWEFSTLTVKQLSSNKVEEVKSCDVSNLTMNFGSTFNGWKPSLNLQFLDSDNIKIISNCELGSGDLTWTIVENVDGYLITQSNGRKWLLKNLNDITATQLILTDLSSFNTSQYEVIYKFSR